MDFERNSIIKLCALSLLVAMTLGLSTFGGAVADKPTMAAPNWTPPPQRDVSVQGLSVAADAKPDAVVDMTY